MEKGSFMLARTLLAEKLPEERTLSVMLFFFRHDRQRGECLVRAQVLQEDNHKQ